MADIAFSRCPGCGLAMPGTGDVFEPRATASVACRAVYAEVVGYELTHTTQLGLWHQLLVDTYAAQHVGLSTPRIGPAFALIGLHLALERGWDGLAVRDAHQRLAGVRRDWPSFLPAPRFAGALTVADVALAETPDAYVTAIRGWAAEVWQAWSDRQPMVRALTSERLDAASGERDVADVRMQTR